jgi:hypothetical protein
LNSNYGIEFIILSNIFKFLQILEVQTLVGIEFELIGLEKKRSTMQLGCQYRNSAQLTKTCPDNLAFRPVSRGNRGAFPHFPAGD